MPGGTAPPSLTSILYLGPRGMILTVLGMLKSGVGTAILSVPHALATTGLAVFPVLLFGFMILGQFGCMLVTKTLDMIGVNDNDPAKVGEFALGVWGKWITLLLTFLDPWMSVMAYLTALVDIVQPMIGDAAGHANTGWYSTGTLVVCMCVVVFPFMLYTDITKMNFVNALGIAALAAFIIAVLVNTAQDSQGFEGVTVAKFDGDTVTALSVIAFAFDGNQLNVFPFYRDLKDPREGKKGPVLSMICLSANSLAALIYFAVSMMAVSTYGDKLDKDVLNNFGNSPIYVIIKISLAVAMLLTIPITMFECTNVLREHVVGSSLLVNITLNAVLLGTAAVIAAFIPNMYAAFAYVGATTATAWTMILPPLWYICTVKKCFGCYFPDETSKNMLLDEPDPLAYSTADVDAEAQKLVHDENAEPDDSIPPPITMYLAWVMMVAGCVTVPFLLAITAMGADDDGSGSGSGSDASNATTTLLSGLLHQ